jgi:hypothetical protein
VTQNNKGALSQWVRTQRKSFRKGEMYPERKRMLNEIGFVFKFKDNANKGNWDLQFNKLQDYCEKYGHSELSWDIDRFIFIVNIATNTPIVALHAL